MSLYKKKVAEIFARILEIVKKSQSDAMYMIPAVRSTEERRNEQVFRHAEPPFKSTLNHLALERVLFVVYGGSLVSLLFVGRI
ncbi:hypothetical protein ANCCAN_02610 [Ancylostoma caninum]|uniref:Uncharacterized protein n=1 Tax=Ancylostoma caninum TaxID=29170 RepID=A0A368H6H9_ANCCA|nr:hypothetical protein ANCCAN_02610 [Ancylostoma caninum]